jgi:hypothetical protein
MARPFPSNGTDAEKRAWAKEQNEAPKPKPASPSSGTPVAPTSTPDAQIEEIKQRKGGYLKKRSDSFWQTTDEHQ